MQAWFDLFHPFAETKRFMSTNFFEHQDQARKNTSRLVWLYALSLIIIIALVYVVLAAIVHFEAHAKLNQPSWWQPQLLVAAAAGVLIVVAGGSLFKIAQLASGGKSVALLLGGREVAPTTRDFHEKRLLNIVEEMALASGVPVPPVYLLADENGINAFAAGYAPGDAIVAVSQGAITYLTRDELQGVVAHEFSHVLNGDMRLNIRLIGLIYGIMVLSIVGLYVMSASGRRSSNSRNDSGTQFFLIGLALYLLGIAGAFFGQMIQAAVSRQREFLADASAVQFTRNPDGIGGALKKIGGLQAGSTIEHAGANEVGHMFFANGIAESFTQMWATHPPLEQRIRQIDPNWDGTFPKVKALDETEERQVDQKRKKPPLAAGMPGMPTLPGMPNVPLPVVLGLSESTPPVGSRRAGTNLSEGPSHPAPPPAEEETHERIPARVRAAIEEPFSARAVIYALLLDPGQAIRDKQLANLAANAEPKDATETRKWEADVRALDEDMRLTVAHLAMPALREMSPRQYQFFRQQVELLIAADEKISLFEFCLERVVIHHLDIAYGLKKAPRVRYWSVNALSPSAIDVLAMLAWQGAAEIDAVRKAFAAGWQAWRPGEQVPELPGKTTIGLDRFAAALDRFIEAAPTIEHRLLQACMACIMADGVVVPREHELLRAICSTLNCPMPVLPAGTAG